ncbi:MAG: InlB B-repeat-containing protein, partial [Clostridiales Family XIII bacterium]|nr:InlB B-repeat-containing protein [Clostridiales Family XIII bacterium]
MSKNKFNKTFGIGRGNQFRLVSVFCALAMLFAMAAPSYANGESKNIVRFYQLSMTAGGAESDLLTRSIAYQGITQYLGDGEEAKNPGAVAYAIAAQADQMHFTGWYEFGAPDSSPYSFAAPVTHDLALFARFTGDCLVTFLNGFGEPFLTKHVPAGAPADVPTEGEMSLFTAPDGKHFDEASGWNLNGAPYSFSAAVAADITLTPTLETGKSFVYFISAGTQAPFEAVATGTPASPPAPPTREGYAFSHWSLQDGGAAFGFASAITRDTTLYAVWTAKQVGYTVSVWIEAPNIAGDAGTDPANYEYSGQFTKTAQAGASTSVLIGGAASAVASQAQKPPAWTVFGFAKATSETVLGNGTTVINAYYKRVAYDFAFTPYDRAVSSSRTATVAIGGQSYSDTNRYGFRAKYEQDVSGIWPVMPLASVAVATGTLKFQGWKVPGFTTIFVSKIITISGDLLPATGTSQTVTANWISSGYTVNLHYMFETEDGQNEPGAVQYGGKWYTQDATYSQSVFSPGNAFSLKEIPGMAALTPNALQKTAANTFAAPKSPPLTDQYLFYDRVRYTITFDSLGGSAVPSAAGLLMGAGLSGKRPADPTRTGAWAFDGWYTDTDFNTAFDFTRARMPGANLILYAKWAQNPYTVSVYDGLAGAVLLGTYIRAQGAYAGDPGAALGAAGVSVGYAVGAAVSGKGIFQGWVVPAGPGERMPLSAEMPVTANLSVYADWKQQAYTVAYLPGVGLGNVPGDTTEYQRGVEARVLAPNAAGGSLAPPAGNMTFVGWTDAAGKLYYPGSTVTVTGDISLTATWDVLDKVSVYVYHINYPAATLLPDPGNITQYAGDYKEFTAIGYNAYQAQEPVGYLFMGWSVGDGTTPGATVVYEGGEKYTAPAANDDIYHLWGVWQPYYSVTFDTGGKYGALTGMDGKSLMTYTVYGGGKLADPNNDGQGDDGIAVPGVTATASGTLNFLGWALAGTAGPILDSAGISGAPVNANVAYIAMYAGSADPTLDTMIFHTVTFDAGGKFGALSAGGNQASYSVKEGCALRDPPIGGAGLSATLGVAAAPGYAFAGWALAADPAMSFIPQADILEAPVTGDVAYAAIYAGLPNPLIEAFYTVTFDAGGTYGALTGVSAASVTMVVRKGTALRDVPGFSVPAVTTANPDLAFVGWSPAVDLAAPVNENRVYTAL